MTQTPDTKHEKDGPAEAAAPNGVLEASSNSDSISISSSHSSHDGQSRSRRPSLDRVSTSVSLGPDNPVDFVSSFVEVPDSVYDRFSPHRKLVIVTLMSVCSFLAPFSSTSVLAATPEVAAEYNTTGTIINVTNAIYMLMMGISPIVWGPLSEVYGRRTVSQITAVLFCGCNIGTALAPNLAAFFVFRILTAFEGTAFILVGSACLA
jgi:hypothetical protein